jgi:hypothetical protein
VSTKTKAPVVGERLPYLLAKMKRRACSSALRQRRRGLEGSRAAQQRKHTLPPGGYEPICRVGVSDHAGLVGGSKERLDWWRRGWRRTRTELPKLVAANVHEERIFRRAQLMSRSPVHAKQPPRQCGRLSAPVGPITSVARRARLGASLTSRPLLWRPVRAGSGRVARITTPPPASAIESRLSRSRLHGVPVAASVCRSAPSRGHSEGTLDTTRVSANANVVIRYGAGCCSGHAAAGPRPAFRHLTARVPECAGIQPQLRWQREPSRDACVQGIHARRRLMTAWKPTKRSLQRQNPCKSQSSELGDGHTRR